MVCYSGHGFKNELKICYSDHRLCSELRNGFVELKLHRSLLATTNSAYSAPNSYHTFGSIDWEIYGLSNTGCVIGGSNNELLVGYSSHHLDYY